MQAKCLSLAVTSMRYRTTYTDIDALLSHPIVGASWEGHVIESLLAVAPAGTQPSFYRSNAGAEIDLLLTWPNGKQWAIEIKRSTTPKV